jgi:hypothetical protein
MGQLGTYSLGIIWAALMAFIKNAVMYATLLMNIIKVLIDRWSQGRVESTDLAQGINNNTSSVIQTSIEGGRGGERGDNEGRQKESS